MKLYKTLQLKSWPPKSIAIFFILLIAFIGFLGGVNAQTPVPVPTRQIPPSVVTELRLLQNRFDIGLAQDCASERCFSKGCVYVDHAVTDRPRSASLPGLIQEQGPGSVVPQEYLTGARCAFAHERSLKASNAQALIKRLQAKLSNGWMVVTVSAQRLPPIPAYLSETPKKPEPKAEMLSDTGTEAVGEWNAANALSEFWLSLLPHFSWMIALIMVTIAALLLIWGWRKLGRISPEEHALLAQMAADEESKDETNTALSEALSIDGDSSEKLSDDFVREQKRFWKTKFAQGSSDNPDLKALISQWLKNGDTALLAKAVIDFPENFPPAFPDGGEYAEAKLKLADYLRKESVENLPSDAVFYRQLQRHALSASLARRDDAGGFASLKQDFGAAGLAEFVSTLEGRFGALLFAHASLDEQFGSARLLAPERLKELATELLRSNRMGRDESDYLVRLLEAARSHSPLPPRPDKREETMKDYGSTYDAASALSVVLPHLDNETKQELFTKTKQRFGGVFPDWYRAILFPGLLLGLGREDRVDLLLEIDVHALSGWLRTLPGQSQNEILHGIPATLDQAWQASVFENRQDQLFYYQQGRHELAEALNRQLARHSRSFEDLVISA